MDDAADPWSDAPIDDAAGPERNPPTNDAAGPASDAAEDSGGLPDIQGDYCKSIPPLPRPVGYLNAIPGTEDFVFDRHGNVITAYWNRFITKTSYTGQTVSVLPYPGSQNAWPQGVRTLLGSEDIIVANHFANQIDRYDSNWSYSVFASGVQANGICLDLSGFVYIAEHTGKVERIDPHTAMKTLIYSEPGRSFDGITFDPTYESLYFGEEVGRIHRIGINPDGTAGAHEIVLEEGQSQIDMTDALTMDECANLYISDVEVGRVWRLAPDGRLDLVADLATDQVTPAINFGSGIGGWKSDHLYVATFEGGMFEINMGVKGKPEPHLLQ